MIITVQEKTQSQGPAGPQGPPGPSGNAALSKCEYNMRNTKNDQSVHETLTSYVTEVDVSDVRIYL